MTDIPLSGDESPRSSTPSLAAADRGPWIAGDRRRAAVAVGVVAAVLASSYLVALIVVGDNIPRGTTVAGVNIGGLTPVDATELLETELAAEPTEIEVSLDGRLRTVDPTRAGLAFDAAATVATIEERSYRPWTLAGQLASHEIPPVVTVAEHRLSKTVASLAGRIDNAAREGAVSYDGLNVVAVHPRAGLALDRSAAYDAIASGYLTAQDSIELPVEMIDPEVTVEQVDEVASGVAVDAIGGPITLEIDGQSLDVSPRQIADVLSFRPVNGELRSTIDVAEFRAQQAGDFSSIGTPARDASFDVSSGRPVVIPAQKGQGVTDPRLSRGIALAIGAPERTAELTLGPIPADLTTAEAKGLQIKRVVSSYTQVFPYAAYRVTNIGLASEKINGTILEPGEVFSLNGIVGERTPENGFVKGYVILGNRLVEDYGGAVSTMTTATWHAAFFAGMTRIEQRAHGYWISRYLPGLEATVSWGNLDLKFGNDTPYGVLVTSSITDTSVTVTMWSSKYWDIDAEFGPQTNPRPAGTVYDAAAGCVAQEGVDGFDITVTRVWSRGGEVKRREPLDTSYVAAPTVICEAKPSPKPKPTKGETDKPKPSQGSSPKPSGGGANSR